MKTLSFLICFLCLQSVQSVQSVQAEVVTSEVHYQADGVTMEGYVAWDDAVEGKRPGILVVHEWWGQTDYPRKRAEMLAELGYTAMAVDMYGQGKEADHPKDAQTFMNEVLANLPGAQLRFEAALDTLKSQPTVDPERTAAIGYCFGGYVVLHMALVGEDLDLVASFHGSLPSQFVRESVDTAPKGMLAIYTGAADPMIPQSDVETFENELKELNANYQVKVYPDAQHSFTNPAATDKGEEFKMPLAYDAEADASSWQDLQNLLKAAFE